MKEILMVKKDGAWHELYKGTHDECLTRAMDFDDRMEWMIVMVKRYSSGLHEN